MKKIFATVAVTLALFGSAHAATLSCRGAAQAVQSVIQELPVAMDKVAASHRGSAEMKKWGNTAFHLARGGIGAISYGLANCPGFEQFKDAQALFNDTANNLRNLGFH